MSEELRQEILELGIGGKIKGMRKKRGMTLARLSDLCGLSTSFLSQIENDNVVPPLTTLLAIARAMEVSLEEFFRAEQSRERISVVKKDEQVPVKRRLPHQVGYHYRALAHRRAEKKMEPFLVMFEPRRKEEMKYFEHPGEEFIYVIDGVIEFRSGDRAHVLEAGDSIYFDSEQLHAVRGLDPGESRALIIVTT